MERRLYRSQSDRMIWGVCGGLAKYFNIDPTIIRVVAVLLVFADGLGILAYIILAIVIPLESSAAATPKDAIKENVAEMKETASELGEEIKSTLSQDEDKAEEADKERQRNRNSNILGIILIAVGIIFLLVSFNVFWWFRWGYFWPVIPIALGLLILITTRRKRSG